MDSDDIVVESLKCNATFYLLYWTKMCSSQWRDLLFVSCVVAERSPASMQQTQHPALVDRNLKIFSFPCPKNLFTSPLLVVSNTRLLMVGWLVGWLSHSWALSS